jgi:hypothetical protein
MTTQSPGVRVPTQTSEPPPVIVREPRRPGLVTFAAVIAYTMAGFFTIAAITEWTNSVWLYQRDFSVAGSHLVFWGFVDIAIAALSAATGYLLFKGSRVGQLLGFFFAGISFIRWMFYIPADPWLAISILVVDGLIIYALATNDEWFDSLSGV